MIAMPLTCNIDARGSLVLAVAGEPYGDADVSKRRLQLDPDLAGERHADGSGAGVRVLRGVAVLRVPRRDVEVSVRSERDVAAVVILLRLIDRQ